MSRRPDPETLNEITAVAEKWLRRCNGFPDEGILIGRAGLRVIVSMGESVAADSHGAITWWVNKRKFTAEPVRDGPVSLDEPNP